MRASAACFNARSQGTCDYPSRWFKVSTWLGCAKEGVWGGKWGGYGGGCWPVPLLRRRSSARTGPAVWCRAVPVSTAARQLCRTNRKSMLKLYIKRLPLTPVCVNRLVDCRVMRSGRRLGMLWRWRRAHHCGYTLLTQYRQLQQWALKNIIVHFRLGRKGGGLFSDAFCLAVSLHAMAMGPGGPFGAICVKGGPFSPLFPLLNLNNQEA